VRRGPNLASSQVVARAGRLGDDVHAGSRHRVHSTSARPTVTPFPFPFPPPQWRFVRLGRRGHMHAAVHRQYLYAVSPAESGGFAFCISSFTDDGCGAIRPCTPATPSCPKDERVPTTTTTISTISLATHVGSHGEFRRGLVGCCPSSPRQWYHTRRRMREAGAVSTACSSGGSIDDQRGPPLWNPLPPPCDCRKV